MSERSRSRDVELHLRSRCTIPAQLACIQREKVTASVAAPASFPGSMAAGGGEKMSAAAPLTPPVSGEAAKAARLSPRLVQSLRKRLGLSQMALARLVGVSAPAGAHWETGGSTPKGQNRAALGARR